MKRILNFCPTGTQSTKQNSLAPIFQNEIIDEVVKLSEEGITIVHLHARDEAGLNTYKREVYQQIIEGIKKYCPDLVIGVSLSGRYFSELNLRSEVLSTHPDMASLTMSSLNFPSSASINSPDTIVYLINEMEKYNVTPEIECFDSGMLRYTQFLQTKGVLSKLLYINVILGNLFNASVALESIAHLKNNFPPNSKICFGGIGSSQFKANIYGLLEADGIRIGLEDNFYLENSTKASNYSLIKRIKNVSDALGMEFMSPNEFREIGILHR
ncbi:3-keto-5-aminohexanoate cleavage protein [Aquirufa ecclesiirivi]|uniref:3-keto-5-aminohexanoate cleavage protein n=1 Tax=Aquirufa ecclesiirivi TaxID=2715124 RepID=UPI0022A862DE|nr:3-keto-5-aminohexanoate cleavage protein [Aquirufa ecclesiirivi]MCZ2471893.1 3-keto-5-aminohexanoate cleavage protein [Aquirufa ecclesiirivi]